MSLQTLESSSAKLWLAAIKPPIYSVAIMPIWVGTAVAVADTQVFNGRVFYTFLISAIFIVIWLNLSNDVFDSETGIDENKPHSLVNLTGNKNLIFGLANLFLILGILGILAIAWWQQDITIIALVVLSCLLGYTYQGPPFRLGYHGLGEIICWIAFGPLAVAAAYYSQTQRWLVGNMAALWIAATVVGLVTSLVLFCSHFHQVEDDIKAGKRSPIVRLGTERGAKLLPWFCGSIYATIVAGIVLEILPMWTILAFGSLPFAWQLCTHVNKYHAQPDKVSNSKFIAISIHASSCSLLGVGFLLNFLP
ncbi:2-carboxy-1,4-naphthoquinone phytyltransferase [Geitlerinema sp. PCC 9228]|jgi:1,4-dihydroxy-2-naphthoate octaprenyltransferase|uniref:2-carboxy-1,4-naphthoquinone phytyltransferase n=1 Tax=Geitlerinema sp. PCC 9228 TaxID=111611 RepID=UPI0008F9E06A|nr:2-carboxy-1,4-naphthoquinone phytyltransferase [Geitlerinema sp. PCC 9228]